MDMQHIAVMCIEGLPRKDRPRVESLLDQIIRTEPVALLPGVDVLDFAACTRWRPSSIPGCVECREVINATWEEFEQLRVALRDVGNHHTSVGIEVIQVLEATRCAG